MNAATEFADTPNASLAQQRVASALRTDLIIQILQPYAKSQLVLPLLIFFADMGAYLLVLFCSLFASNIWLQTLCAILTGFSIGILFIVGHDSCHGSFTQVKWLNHLLGRLCFLPSLHPFSLQHVWHNRTHHRYTNYTEKDFLFAPMSKEQYETMSSARQALYRLYRTWMGHGIYYFYEIWWKKMIRYPRSEIGNLPVQLWDRLLVGMGAISFLTLLTFLPSLATPWGFTGLVAWKCILFGFIIPYIVWNWMMGFLIYQHHTHPTVAWFKDYDQWDYMNAQMEGSVHVRYPTAFNLLLHNIMEHTAHHAHMQIPLYRLKAAQIELQQNCNHHMRVIDWSWKEYFRSVRDCKLYDYKTHHWLNFQGNRTSPCTLADYL